MQKSDESIRSIVTASIKRHSMHLETWEHTQLREQWSEAMQEWIARTIVLLPSELGIIGYLESENYGYLLTTQRLIIYENNVVRTLDLDNIKDFRVGLNFKGHQGQSTETMTLHCKDGRTEQFRYETGYPSMGAIYGLMTVLRIRKPACR